MHTGLPGHGAATVRMHKTLSRTGYLVQPSCDSSASVSLHGSLTFASSEEEEENGAFTADRSDAAEGGPAGEQPREGRGASGAAPGAVAREENAASILKTAVLSSPASLPLLSPGRQETLVGSMPIYDGDIAAERSGQPTLLNSSCERETRDRTKGPIPLRAAQGKQHQGVKPHSEQNEEDYSSDSDHFDLSHLETPREGELSCASHEDESQGTEQDGAAQVERGAESRARFELQQGETDVPIPPPRHRSRSRTPPSDNDDHFQMRRKKHKAKKRLKESMQEQQAALRVMQKACEVTKDVATGCNESVAVSRQSEEQQDEPDSSSDRGVEQEDEETATATKTEMEDEQEKQGASGERRGGAQEEDWWREKAEEGSSARGNDHESVVDKGREGEAETNASSGGVGEHNAIASPPKTSSLDSRRICSPSSRLLKSQVVNFLENSDGEHFLDDKSAEPSTEDSNIVRTASIQISRTGSLEDELRVREELAQHACKTQDVAALCFALSFTKSRTTTDGGMKRPHHWQEVHLSPLHEAAAVGSIAMLTLLLDSDNFTIDSRTTSGNTSLHICIWEGHARAAEYLLSRGANANIENRHGHRAFDFLLSETLQPFSPDDLPELMNAAARRAIQMAEKILGVCAQDCARVVRQRFRDLTALAHSALEQEDVSQDPQSGDPSEGDGAERQGRQKYLSLLCAAYNVLLHRLDVKYVAGCVSFRKTVEWAEIFLVLETKGLADVVDWFVQNNLDGHAFLDLSVDRMQALGLSMDRAQSIWKHLHGQECGGDTVDAPVDGLKEWLLENGEVALLPELQSHDITTVEMLLISNLKFAIKKVGPRLRLQRAVDDYKATSRAILCHEISGFRAQAIEGCQAYIPVDSLSAQNSDPGNSARGGRDSEGREQHARWQANRMHREKEVIMSGNFDAELRDAMIDMSDELAASVRREKQTQVEMRVRVQKLKIRVRELKAHADEAAERASCAVAEQEEVLLQLAQQAQVHAKLTEENDAKVISLKADLNKLKAEILTDERRRAWHHVRGSTKNMNTTASVQLASPSQTLRGDDSLSSSLSMSSPAPSARSMLEQISAQARLCVHKKFPRLDHNSAESASPRALREGNESFALSSNDNRENGLFNGNVSERQLPVSDIASKEANRTLRLINKELQLQAMDLQTTIAEGKRDKLLNESAIMVLQQRVSMLTNELSLEKRQREQDAREAISLRDQAESLLNAVTRLVVHEEMVDNMCQDALQLKLRNQSLLQELRRAKACMGQTQECDCAEMPCPKISTAPADKNEAPAAGFYCEKSHQSLRHMCLESRVAQNPVLLPPEGWREIELLLLDRDRLHQQLVGVSPDEDDHSRGGVDVLSGLQDSVACLQEELMRTQEELRETQERMLTRTVAAIQQQKVHIEEKEAKHNLMISSLCRSHDHADESARRQRETEDAAATAALHDATKAIERLEEDVSRIRKERFKEAEQQQVVRERQREREAEWAEERGRFAAAEQEWIEEKVKTEKKRAEVASAREQDKAEFRSQQQAFQLEKTQWETQKRLYEESISNLEAKCMALQESFANQRQELQERDLVETSNESERALCEVWVSQLEQQYSMLECELSKALDHDNREQCAHDSRTAEQVSRWLPLPSSPPEMTRTGSPLKGPAVDASTVPGAQHGVAARDSADVLEAPLAGCASEAAAVTLGDLDEGLPDAAPARNQSAVVLRTVSVERSRLAEIASSQLMLPRDSAASE